MMEISRLELLTFALQKHYSTDWTIFPSWVILELNQRPYPYQGYALSNWANNPFLKINSFNHSNNNSSRTFRYDYLVTTSPQLLTILLIFCSKKSLVTKKFLSTTNSQGVTGGVYRDRDIFTAVWLTCNYLRFRLYVDEFQSTIRAKKTFKD